MACAIVTLSPLSYLCMNIAAMQSRRLDVLAGRGVYVGFVDVEAVLIMQRSQPMLFSNRPRC